MTAKSLSVPGLVLALALSACAVPRGPAESCTTGFVASQARQGATLVAGPDPNDVVETAVERLIDSQREAKRTLGAPEVATIDYLLMSTGGQYGAFGSGFLAGWSRNPVTPRPDFNVVTGASAGGILAPLAFLGSGYDDRLPFRGGLGIDAVARKRSGPELLASNSLFDPAPYEALVRRTVDGRMVQDLAARSDDGTKVFVGTVNLDTGLFDIIDLGLMADTERNAEKCIEEAILATSAIPLVFPPRHVNGDLFADAGLRDHLFLNAVREGIRRATARGATVRTNAYIIINGDLGGEGGRIENSIPGIAARSISIASDEGLRKSVLEILRLAELTKWDIKAIAAHNVDLSACDQAADGGDLFSACVTERLFAAGEAYGASAEIPWLTADELRDLAAQR